jgi:hypothetical protein
LIILSFFVFISPVLYCYYLQYDLHPEKIIRGKSGWSGVKFILWQQTFERYEGKSFGGAASNDYFFFFHSFLWAFAPWSILAYIAVVKRVKSFVSRKYEWLTTGTFLVMALMITFSGFKLPHYINIIFPSISVLTSAFLIEKAAQHKVQPLLITQIVVSVLCLLVAAIINTWAFPMNNLWLITVAILLIVFGFLNVRSLRLKIQKLIALSVLTSAIIFYLLNVNFYPQLLTYQGGNELAFTTREKINPKDVYIWPRIYNPSFQFYTRELKKDFTDTVLQQQSPVWVLTDKPSLPQLKERNLQAIEQYSNHDYNIGTMSFKFINPATRRETLDTLYVIRVK